MKRTPMPARKTPLKSTTPIRKRRPGKRRTEAVYSSAWLDLVRAIPCCVRCGVFGVEAAHRDEGKGASMKTDDCFTAALCPGCHFELGNGKELSREERRREMDRAILATIRYLWRAGKIGATK